MRGVLWGQAVGDALGLGTEFMTRADVARAYPRGLASYAEILRDGHRSRWPVGAWTDDTDQMLCILESLLACGTVSPADIGRRIARWAETSGLGIGRTVQRAMDRNGFLVDPVSAARQAWEDGRARHAANGGVMRTSVLGLWDLEDAERVADHAAAACRVTHYDPRCVASCIVVALAIRALVLDPTCDRPALVATLARTALRFDPRCAEAFDAAAVGDVDALGLDEGMVPGDNGRIGYTLKALAAGLWAVLHAPDFATGVTAIVMAGGDADSNAAVAGALLGARFGRAGIPPRWISELRDHARFAALVEAFVVRAPYVEAPATR